MASSTADQQLCRRFSLAEIQSATGDFSDAQVIGKGGFGKVYKGLIDNGSLTVAIKRLAANSKQGEREFAAEMETLTKFRHRNLVSLIGYCSEEEEMILVYEYMANGTLADHLYSSNGSSLSWNKRLKICIGAGRGLDYLHYGCSIIHRDVKSTNILLDDNFTAKVSDFGLAKTLSTDMLERSFVSTNIKGSFGYFDPSYFTTGRLTMASDTYAFGVLLLEILTGKPPIGRNLAEDELCMTMWAQEKIRNGKADQIVDLNLKGEISEGCLKTFVGVVKRCLHYEPKKRLTMTRAVVQLELALEQQEKKGITTAPRILQFWNRVIPSAGSTENDENEVEVDELPISPAIEEDRPDHIVDTFPIYVPAIPLADIRKITYGFSSKCMIYREFGAPNVHGVLESGQYAIIIRLCNELPKFIAHVSKVSRLEHENMVKLAGYCLNGYDQVLVHKFAPRPRGSLHDILHGRQGIKGLHMEPCRALSWAQRVKIAVGIAAGLCYMHHNDLIHDNIASNNILLFNDDIAKIHNLYPSTECSCTDDYYHREYHPNKFRPCNHPPEYAQSGGQADKKGDVYSFGVVLLELLTGAKVFDSTRGLWEHNIVSWAQPKLRWVELHEIVDVGFKADYPPKEVKRMAKVAASCLRDVFIRPDMSVVLRELKAIEDKEEDGIENKPIAAPAALQADHIVNMLPIYVPTFSLTDIKDITPISDKCMIRCGFGGGNVFHGILKSGQGVAIKKLGKELPDHEFIAQVSRVSSLKHGNIVELVGYCLDDGLRVLVYEFSPRGSLHDILHGIKGLDMEPCLDFSWAQRVKIAVGIAEGLCYIHDKNLIHHNIKSSNILVFNDDIAKLTDLGPPTQRSCPCNIPNCDEHPLSRRSGYHPPEYIYELGDQTQKDDVYRFGVILLELLTGSKLVDSTRRVGQQNIVSWALPQLGSDKVHKIVDARLKADYPPKAVHKMALVAALCIQYDAEFRPNMSVVLRALRRILPKPQ